MWRAESAMPAANAVLALSGASAFRKGLLTNVTNPKSALFFGSIFAAVFPPSPGLLLQCLTVIVVMANAFCWYGGLAYLFSRGRVRLAYARARATINRIAAGLFGVLGLGLLVAALREIFSSSVQVTN
jgi:threonine efflux protein